jgi:SagB-type dehydrogenase family enzyme
VRPSRVAEDHGALFYAASANVRARSLDLDPDLDRRPRAFRTYPGAARTALAGRDCAPAEPLGESLRRRRSQREFAPGILSAELAGGLLRASAGVRAVRRVEERRIPDRPYPSAGGLYPVELYAAAQDVEGIADGVHHYDPRAHELELRRAGRWGPALADLTIAQPMLAAAQLVVALTAVPERSTWKYGERGWRYAWLEAGHVAANLCLVAQALGLVAVEVGGFYDDELTALLALPAGELPLLLVAVGLKDPGGQDGAA